MVFKMRDSVPIPRYSPICNVLCQWKTLLIPTYRVYQLYDTTFESGLVAPVYGGFNVYTTFESGLAAPVYGGFNVYTTLESGLPPVYGGFNV